MSGLLRSWGLGLWSRARGVRVDPYIWLVIALAAFAVLPLAGPAYFFDAHDAPHSVFFLTEFDAALRDGIWYPGWATDQALGYGYPTFVLYPPLAYYAAEVIHLLGATKIAAIKWTWALATVGAGLAMYAYARHILGRQRGVLAAVLYVFIPYHLIDIYVRAALAEYCAFVWMPIALLAFHRLVARVTARRVGLAGLAFGALWMTHNVTGLVFTPLLAAYVLFRLVAQHGAARESNTGRGPSSPTSRRGALGDSLRRAGASLAAAGLGLGLAGALLLPNLFERSAINQEQWVRASYDYALHFVYPFQFLSPYWGYGAAGAGPQDGMSYQLGAVPVVLACAALIRARRRTRERAVIAFFGGATILLLILMLPVSASLWEVLPIAALIQFPWRLLALSAVTLTALGSLAIGKPDSRRQSAPILVIALVAVLASFPYTRPEYTAIPASAEGPLLSLEFELEYSDMVGRTAWTEELPTSSPLVDQYLAGEPLTTAEALAAGAEVEMIRAGGASDELWVRSPAGTELRFFTYYFPGWRVYVDGERLLDSALRPDPPLGLLVVDIPPGEHRVLLRWGDTPIRAMGKALSLTCFGLALAMAIRRTRSTRGSAQ